MNCAVLLYYYDPQISGSIFIYRQIGEELPQATAAQRESKYQKRVLDHLLSFAFHSGVVLVWVIICYGGDHQFWTDNSQGIFFRNEIKKYCMVAILFVWLRLKIVK
jgi:hypothetical protein